MLVSLKIIIDKIRVRGQITWISRFSLYFLFDRIARRPIIANMYAIGLYSSKGELFSSKTPQPFLNSISEKSFWSS
ncbi:hypothetical protein CMI38_01225 [Candidatus Pacearchaeota archaeon]|nr:hypothetical protein [Candidatus Pacearchaeota archaeon]